MRVPVEYVLSQYQPGAGDLKDGTPWTWSDEFASLWSIETAYMARLLDDIVAQGIQEPILLGNDDRLWDGHHRLAAAVALCHAYIEVDYAPKEDA